MQSKARIRRAIPQEQVACDLGGSSMEMFEVWDRVRVRDIATGLCNILGKVTGAVKSNNSKERSFEVSTDNGALLWQNAQYLHHQTCVDSSDDADTSSDKGLRLGKNLLSWAEISLSPQEFL